MAETQLDLVSQFRENTFKNEAFVIGILQVVSGGALLTVGGKLADFTPLVSSTYLPWVLTLCAVALVLAIAAALLKDEYLRFALKCQVRFEVISEECLYEKYGRLSQRFLGWMRGTLYGSTGALILAFLTLALAMWARIICP